MLARSSPVLLCRYASLYFLACVDDDDNELIVLETIHHFVEVRRALWRGELSSPALSMETARAERLFSANGRCSTATLVTCASST